MARASEDLVNTINAALAASKAGDPQTAYGMLTEVLPRVRAGGASPALVVALNNLATLEMGRNNTHAAAALLHECIGAATAIGDANGVRRACTNIAALASGQGDHAQAVAMHTRNLQIAHAMGRPAAEVIALCGIAWNCLRLGDVDGSQRAVTDAKSALCRDPVPPQVAQVTIAQARLDLCCGDHARARAAFAWAAEHAGDAGWAALCQSMVAVTDVVGGDESAVASVIAIAGSLADAAHARAAAHRAVALAMALAGEARARLISFAADVATRLDDGYLRAEVGALHGGPADATTVAWMTHDRDELWAPRPRMVEPASMPWVSGVDDIAPEVPVDGHGDDVVVGGLHVRRLEVRGRTTWSLVQDVSALLGTTENHQTEMRLSSLIALVAPRLHSRLTFKADARAIGVTAADRDDVIAAARWLQTLTSRRVDSA